MILYGLRGVGKTVLLNRIQIDAQALGFANIRVEAPEERSLPAVLIPALRGTLLRLDRSQAIRDVLQRARNALSGFAQALRVKYNDIEVGLDFPVEPGLADSGDLDSDLTDLFMTIGQAGREYGTAMVLFIDELQYVQNDQLASLLRAIHNANQAQLPIIMLAAGLPQLISQLGRAKSYAERLFEFIEIGRLDDPAARSALEIPAARAGVDFTPEAIGHILQKTLGYPYFLQEWGRFSWEVADESPITEDVAIQASELALNELDRGFFRVRFDRLTPTERRYLRAMADLGPGPHRSGDIAERLGRNVTNVAPVRSSLIKKGMLYSPAHGDNAFTVPLFDGFMKRIMPPIS